MTWTGGACAPSASLAPQNWQNAMWEALAPRQRGHATISAGALAGCAAASPGSGEPQLAQKRPCAGLAVPQRTQRFSVPLGGGAN
jgi:hypothetical protein